LPDAQADRKPLISRRLGLILALAGVALVVVAVLVWVNRKAIARDVLVGVLKSRGVAAQADIDTLDLSNFGARLSLGDPRRPVVSLERVQARYHLSLTGLAIDEIEVTRPVLNARFTGGRLVLGGGLDPLVQEFLRRPPPPVQPQIRITGGVLALATDYGAIRATGNVLVQDGKVRSLVGSSAPTRLKGEAFDIALGQGAFSESSKGERLTAAFAVPLTTAAAAGGTVRDGRLVLNVDAPYPDLVRHRGDGPLTLTLSVAGRDLGVGERRFASGALSAAFVGQTRGWIADLAVSGRATGDLTAGGGAADGVALAALKASLATDDIRWTRAGGDAASATLRLNAHAEDLRAGDLRLAVLDTAVTGPVSYGRPGAEATLTAATTGEGGWNGLGAVTADDAASVAALKRAARSFRIDAPAAVLRVKGGYVAAALPRPFSLRTATGGTAQVASRNGAAIVSPTGGAFTLSVKGGGLPEVSADVANAQLKGGVLNADAAFKAKLSIAALEGAQVDAAGHLRAANGGASFAASRCVAVAADRITFGADNLSKFAGQFCQTTGPVLSVAANSWRLRGRLQGGGAEAPFLEAKLAGLTADADVGREGAHLKAAITLASAEIDDVADPMRFRPLHVAGTFAAAGDSLQGQVAVKDSAGHALATGQLAHDIKTGAGQLTIDTGTLTLASGGLQPGDLSPLTAAIGSPVTGEVAFKGGFRWSRDGSTSEGLLSIPSLDFSSPAGRVEGLKGQVAFTSLAPLAAAPGQMVTVDKVDSLVPLTHITAHFALADNILRISGGEGDLEGGKVSVENLDIPLTAQIPTRGVLIFQGVQLHDIVEASPFKDVLDLDAKVSGRTAFETADGHVRVPSGNLKADQPGRLSINRAALDDPHAAGAVVQGDAQKATAVDPNATFTDLAYQAMENLAFDSLDSTVASQADGKLGVLFHIKGQHDPPKNQQILISVTDLIGRRFLNKPLPLPSGTKVNLTLDTTLNLDQLLADYAEYRRLHGSGGVQP